MEGTDGRGAKGGWGEIGGFDGSVDSGLAASALSVFHFPSAPAKAQYFTLFSF